MICDTCILCYIYIIPEACEAFRPGRLHVCLSVCLSTRLSQNSMSRLHCTCYLLSFVARGSSGDNVIRHAVVSWMISCFHTMGHIHIKITCHKFLTYSPEGATLFDFVLVYNCSKTRSWVKSAIPDCLVVIFFISMGARSKGQGMRFPPAQATEFCPLLKIIISGRPWLSLSCSSPNASRYSQGCRGAEFLSPCPPHTHTHTHTHGDPQIHNKSK